MQNIQNMLTFPNVWISLLPDAIETVSEVANTKVSHSDSENLEAHCFKISRLWQACKCIKICNICLICKIFNLTAPPARSLYIIMGPGGRWASASRITDNKVVVFVPELHIKEAKSNCCWTGCSWPNLWLLVVVIILYFWRIIRLHWRLVLVAWKFVAWYPKHN